MEKQKISLENGKGTNGQKTRKVVIIILSVSFLIILAGAIIYQLLLSRAEEDIYFIRSFDFGNRNNLYCYDATENQVLKIAEIEGYIINGMVDESSGKFLYWTFDEEEDYLQIAYGTEIFETPGAGMRGAGNQLVAYDLETGRTEICFTLDEIEERMGLTLESVIFDRTDKSIVYLKLSTMADDEKQRFLAKYVLETGEVTDLQEVDHGYAFACNGDFYIGVGEKGEFEILDYEMCSAEQRTLVKIDDTYGGFCDVTADGKSVLLIDEGTFGRRYFIRDIEDNKDMTIARTLSYRGKVFTYYMYMGFIGESNDCVYVERMPGFFVGSCNNTLWIKEPGHLARKVYSCGFSSMDYLRIMS